MRTTARHDRNCPHASDRARLAAWLDEWRLEQALAEADPPEWVPARAAADGVRAAQPKGEGGRDASGSTPAAGQIRLLCPEDAVTAARPLYLFLARGLSAEDWGAVPFGRLATPAIPGEWRTGLRGLPVRVLCAWNARRVNAERLRRSWHVATPSASWCAAARRIVAGCRAASEGGPDASHAVSARAGAAARFGPPLRHPLDPRWMYLAWETERGSALGPPWGRLHSGRCYRFGPMADASGAPLYERGRPHPARKAADPCDPYADPRGGNG